MEEDISDGYELDEEFDGDLESSAFSDSQSIDSRSCGEPVSEKDTQVHLEEEMVSDLGLMPVPVDENPFLKPRTSSDVSPRILKRGEILSDGGNNANVTFSLNQAEKWPNLASVVKDTCLNGNSMNVDEIMGMNQYGNNKLKLIPGRINDKGRHVADMDPLLEEGSKAWGMTLMGYFVGMRMGHREILGHLRRMWRAYHLGEVIMNECGLYFFKFKAKEVEAKHVDNVKRNMLAAEAKYAILSSSEIC
ncbi:hypothetical protein Tco_1432845 [Tanacetum coccineum]